MTMAQPTFKGEKAFITAVAQNKMMEETVSKEMRHHKIVTEFSINPFRKMQTISGKVNNIDENVIDDCGGDAHMRYMIRRSQLPPPQRYDKPQTGNQEYGWLSKPLVERDRMDKRISFYKRLTDITQWKEFEWSLDRKPDC